MPAIERSIHTDEKDTFQLLGAIFAFAMQAWNVAGHELTSRDAALPPSLRDKSPAILSNLRNGNWLFVAVGSGVLSG